MAKISSVLAIFSYYFGGIAQLVRVPASHAGGSLVRIQLSPPNKHLLNLGFAGVFCFLLIVLQAQILTIYTTLLLKNY